MILVLASLASLASVIYIDRVGIIQISIREKVYEAVDQRKRLCE